MKRGSFDERVASCMARFHDVEARLNAKRDRYNEPRLGQAPTNAKPVSAEASG